MRNTNGRRANFLLHTFITHFLLAKLCASKEPRDDLHPAFATEWYLFAREKSVSKVTLRCDRLSTVAGIFSHGRESETCHASVPGRGLKRVLVSADSHSQRHLRRAPQDRIRALRFGPGRNLPITITDGRATRSNLSTAPPAA